MAQKEKIDTVERAKKAVANAQNLPPAKEEQNHSKYPFIKGR